MFQLLHVVVVVVLVVVVVAHHLLELVQRVEMYRLERGVVERTTCVREPSYHQIVTSPSREWPPNACPQTCSTYDLSASPLESNSPFGTSRSGETRFFGRKDVRGHSVGSPKGGVNRDHLGVHGEGRVDLVASSIALSGGLKRDKSASTFHQSAAADAAVADPAYFSALPCDCRCYGWWRWRPGPF